MSRTIFHFLYFWFSAPVEKFWDSGNLYVFEWFVCEWNPETWSSIFHIHLIVYGHLVFEKGKLYDSTFNIRWHFFVSENSRSWMIHSFLFLIAPFYFKLVCSEHFQDNGTWIMNIFQFYKLYHNLFSTQAASYFHSFAKSFPMNWKQTERLLIIHYKIAWSVSLIYHWIGH